MLKSKVLAQMILWLQLEIINGQIIMLEIMIVTLRWINYRTNGGYRMSIKDHRLLIGINKETVPNNNKKRYLEIDCTMYL